MAQNEKGQEVPDPTPVEVPLRFRGQHESLHEKILRYIRSEQFRQKAEEEGFESEEEANDFEVEEEGSDLPISNAEAAMMLAEELDIRKKEILDIEGKARYNVSQEVSNDRAGKVGVGLQEGEERNSGVGRVGEKGSSNEGTRREAVSANRATSEKS